MMGKKIIIQFLASGLAGLLAFLVLSLSSRLFGAKILGEIAYLSGLLGLVFGFSDLGLSRAHIHFTAANREYPALASFMTMKSLLLFLCVVAALTVGIVNRQLSWLFLVLLTFEVVSRLADSVLVTFEGREKVWPQNLTRLAGKFIKLLAVIVFALMWRSSLGYSLTYLVEAVVVLGLAVIISRGLWRFKLEPAVIKNYWRYSLPFALIMPLTYFQDNGLILILRRFWPAETLGVYVASLGLFSLLKGFTSSLMVFFFPRISRLNKRRDLGQIQQYTDTAVKFSLWLLLPLAVILFLVTDWVVPLILGQQFIGAVSIFRWWLLGILILGVFNPYDHVLFATRNHQSIVWVNLVTTVLVLLLGWQLIPVLGGQGAAIAAVSTWFLGGLSQFLLLRRKTGIRFLSDWRLTKVEVKYLYGLVHSFSQTVFRPGRKETG